MRIGGIHPCKIVPHLQPHVRVGFKGKEEEHNGDYELLPFTPELMALVPCRGGQIPAGRRPVIGGIEDGQPLYHAVAKVDDLWIPDKVAPQLGTGNVPYHDKEFWREECMML
ncbi:hypothetical protein Dda_4181 [Drechslerella dactyloides]|uniref:Uncharacterized protein n=1 Tax=Drechslerella dactyloides TaxID=74499 RepID=A0AAD6J3L2_DREDA|nr:hypothetical protein Dda_4181 [Drechslerella dactyloides]